MTREIRVVPIQGAEAGAGPRHADVIFVHGLMGDPKATWTASAADGSESFWPQWIAREFPGVAVWSVDYPTTVSRWVGRSIPLFELATNIADGLLVKDIGVNRPLILVGHSMGGLVIKKILLESSNHSQARWTLLSANAKAVMFLATPHTGSDLPALENFLETLATHLLVAGSVSSFVFSFVAKLFGRKSTSMDELKNNAPMLRDLNLSFRQYVERRRDANPLQVCVYYETQQTWGLQVVTESSADPGLPTADLVALVANHLEICKFPDEGDGARPFHRLKELLPSIIVPQGAPANTVSAPSATGPASPQETLRAEADDATLLAPRPTSLAVAELGLDDPLAGFIVCACVVTDAADELVQHIEGWKAQAGRPAGTGAGEAAGTKGRRVGSVRRSGTTADLAGLAGSHAFLGLCLLRDARHSRYGLGRRNPQTFPCSAAGGPPAKEKPVHCKRPRQPRRPGHLAGHRSRCGPLGATTRPPERAGRGAHGPRKPTARGTSAAYRLGNRPPSVGARRRRRCTPVRAPSHPAALREKRRHGRDPHARQEPLAVTVLAALRLAQVEGLLAACPELGPELQGQRPFD